jgi:hypothetical protein
LVSTPLAIAGVPPTAGWRVQFNRPLVTKLPPAEVSLTTPYKTRLGSGIPSACPTSLRTNSKPNVKTRLFIARILRFGFTL